MYEHIELAQAAGISVRQLDMWTRTGLVKCEEQSPGSGHRRTWPESEQEIVHLMARLVEGGMTVRGAATVARDWVENGAKTVNLGKGLVLAISEGVMP